MKSLREVCEMTGTNRQFLQRLAYKGKEKYNNREPYLLPPSEVKGSGEYWYYNDDAIQRLWMILMFRELDGKLSEIENIMNSEDFDRNTWLSKQIELLTKKQEYIGKLISAANLMLTTGIMLGEIYDSNTYTISDYLETSSKAQNVCKETMDRVSHVLGCKEFDLEYKYLIKLMSTGVGAESIKAQRAVGRMWKVFRSKMGEGSQVGFHYLGLMFYNKGTFSEAIDKSQRKGVAHYIGKAIVTYCKRHNNMEDLK